MQEIGGGGLMETNDKPSYCPEHHKWAIRIYPGGRNKWEIVPERWDVHGAVSASNVLLKGECAWVADRETAEDAWWLFQTKRAVR